MRKFRQMIEAEISESAASGLDGAIAKLESLQKQLQPGKVIPKKITAELGSGYDKDFKKVNKLLGEVLSILSDIQHDAEVGGI